VVHRDIKPENLLLTRDGNTLVADFGIARALSGDESGGPGSEAGDTRLTETGMSIGTPAYMSPEQALGDRQLDGGSDEYSLGCVLYEMLAGEPPFTGPTAQALVAKRLAGPPPRVSIVRPGVPPQVAGALDRALAVSPADRYRTVGEFARALEAGPATTGVSPEPRAAPTRRNPAVPAMVVVAVIALGYLGLRWAGVLPGDTLRAAGALAPSDQLVLTDFADRAGDSSLAAALTEAFRVDFAESGLVSLASPDRVRGTLRLMQRPDTAPLTAALGREVAQRDGLKAVLTGDVSRLGEGYMITAQVIGADSGRVLAAHRETAAGAADIIPAVDRLSRRLRRKVGESLRQVRASPPLDAVSTASLEALRQYAQGARLHDLGRNDESLPFLEEAVRLDPNFAMAWRAIGTGLWNLDRDPARVAAALARAYELRDRLTERERYGAEAQYYDMVLGNRAKARAAWRSLLAIDPRNVVALTDLGLINWFEGDYAAAESLADVAIRADSNHVAAYYNLTDAQVTRGRFAAAETTLARWRARFGADAAYQVQVGYMASARGDYDSAARAFRRGLDAGTGGADRANAARLLGMVATVRGQLEQARRFERLYAELEDREDVALWPILSRVWAATSLGMGREAALRQLDSLLASPGFKRLDAGQRHYGEIALAYARAGRPERARAVAKEERQTLEAQGPAGDRLLGDLDHRMFREGLEGQLLVQQGRFREAVAHFEAAARVRSDPGWLPDMGFALDRAGDADSALTIYRSYLASSWNYRLQFDPVALIPVLRRTGELYEARGDTAQATQAYQRVLSLWRDADPVLQPQAAEIRRRLSELTAEPR
jgi:tetratricopeptide (TPR) repeat protein